MALVGWLWHQGDGRGRQGAADRLLDSHSAGDVRLRDGDQGGARGRDRREDGLGVGPLDAVDASRSAGDAASIAASLAGVLKIGHGETLARTVDLVEDGDLALVLGGTAVFDVAGEAHERWLVVVEVLAVWILQVGVLGDVEGWVAAFVGEALEGDLDVVGHDRRGGESEESGELDAVHV